MERPKIPVFPTVSDLFLEVAGVLFLFASLVYIGFHYQDLPEIIPVHFNLQGEVDGFGSKNTLWALPLIGLAIFAGMTVLCKYPHIFNYPVEVTRRNVIRQYRLAVSLIRWIKIETAFIFGVIVVETVQVANGESLLPSWFVAPLVAILFGTIIVYLVKASRAA
ncbi:MAG: DUF1648 domain-containing protein [Bacteroidota bacterium]